MASIFGHVAASTALGKSFFPEQARWPAIAVAGFCAFAPDLDVIGFSFGIPYNSPWGHRGWTHSLLFAVLFGWLNAWLFKQWVKRRSGTDHTKAFNFFPTTMFFILATLSHPLLDMLTNGGRGVALFFPFDNRRLFFPFRPIQVSPLGAGNFFSEWGLRVLWSEAIWIGLPAITLVVFTTLARRLFSASK